MGLMVELDLTNVNDLDQVENGDNVPVGWYRANVADHYEDHGKEGTYVWVFEVVGGLYAGKKLFYRIGDPRLIDDEKKAKMAQARIAALAVRFGLVGGDALGKPGVGVDFDQSINKEMVVRVVEQKGDRGTFLQIGYLDVYPLDHDKIPKEARLALSLPPAREKKAAAPTGPTLYSNGATPPPATQPAGVDPWAGL